MGSRTGSSKGGGSDSKKTPIVKYTGDARYYSPDAVKQQKLPDSYSLVGPSLFDGITPTSTIARRHRQSRFGPIGTLSGYSSTPSDWRDEIRKAWDGGIGQSLTAGGPENFRTERRHTSQGYITFTAQEIVKSKEDKSFFESVVGGVGGVNTGMSWGDYTTKVAQKFIPEVKVPKNIPLLQAPLTFIENLYKYPEDRGKAVAVTGGGGCRGRNSWNLCRRICNIRNLQSDFRSFGNNSPSRCGWDRESAFII